MINTTKLYLNFIVKIQNYINDIFKIFNFSCSTIFLNIQTKANILRFSY